MKKYTTLLFCFLFPLLSFSQDGEEPIGTNIVSEVLLSQNTPTNEVTDLPPSGLSVVELDPSIVTILGSLTGLLKSDGNSNFTFAVPGTDYPRVEDVNDISNLVDIINLGLLDTSNHLGNTDLALQDTSNSFVVVKTNIAALVDFSTRSLVDVNGVVMFSIAEYNPIEENGPVFGGLYSDIAPYYLPKSNPGTNEWTIVTKDGRGYTAGGTEWKPYVPFDSFIGLSNLVVELLAALSSVSNLVDQANLGLLNVSNRVVALEP